MNKKTLLKTIISILLVAFIFYKININEFLATVANANIAVFSISFLSLIFQQWLIAYTWYIVVKAQQHAVPMWRVVQVHFIGNFFGTFLPTSIGMDIIRAYSLSRHLKQGVDAASSMFVVRVIGFLVLFLMALAMCIFQGDLIQDAQIIWVIVVTSILFTAGVLVMFIPPIRNLLYRLLLLFRIRSVKEKLEYFYSSTIQLAQYRSLLVKIIIISFLMQVIGIINFYLIGVALHIPVPLAYYFLYLPIIQVIIMIPISIAGIGVREGTFVYFFSQIGAQQAEALSLSILMFSQAIGLALIGGILYWTSNIKLPAKSEAV
ncbi:flippase-like domain-containing protein [candidate division KSB1 bacterium]|nr:flippase-like domain-containing protein [candidate division KSB1 bacterium]